MPGVIRTRVGYAGGTKDNPTYRSIGDHSETIQVDYDPSKISYRDLLKAFWTGHEPAHPSWSRQYASIIFTHNDGQQREAEESRAEFERTGGRKVQTEIKTYTGFTRAEDYHQKHSLRQFPSFYEELSRIYPSFNDFIASTAVARVNGYLGGDGSHENLKKEADSLGLSLARKDELLRIAERRWGRQTCPLPEKEAAAGAR